jgi:hypothetical protein
MIAAAAPATSKMNGCTAAALAGGLTAGLFDIVYAVGSAAARGGDPTNILLAISSGILGADAFSGGAAVATLGLALHFMMTLIMAWIFLIATRLGLGSISQYPLLSGPLYGVGIYFIMQQVVLPLSRVPLRDPRPPINFLDLAVHMFLVGLPIALAAFHWRSR